MSTIGAWQALDKMLDTDRERERKRELSGA